MKTFARTKTLDEICKQCLERGLSINIDRYINEGHDHVAIMMPGPDGQRVLVLFNTFNGRFFHSSEYSFSSDDSIHDGQPWFDDMLDFFYAEK